MKCTRATNIFVLSFVSADRYKLSRVLDCVGVLTVRVVRIMATLAKWKVGDSMVETRVSLCLSSRGWEVYTSGMGLSSGVS